MPMQRSIAPQPTRGRIAGLVLVVGFAAGLAGCKGEAAVSQESLRPVKVAQIAAASPKRTLTYSGVVRPRVESALGFRVSGKIIARSVNVGDRIEMEQTIARVDDTDLKLAENAARAGVASARSRRDVASDNLQRAKVLSPKAIISQAAYDTRRNELDAASAALDAAEAQLRQAVNAVGYTTLRADKAGIVTAVVAEPGQVVNAGQAVATVAESGETEVAIAVPEQDAARIAVDQNSKVTLWAGSGVNLDGRVREIAGQADPVSRTYAVRIAIDTPPQAMRLGMTALVALTIEDETTQMVVPLTALTEEGGTPIAFVVDTASKAVRKTAVTIAGIAEGGVRIASGLQPGDLIVTAGVQFLQDGMRIRLPGERAQTGAQ